MFFPLIKILDCGTWYRSETPSFLLPVPHQGGMCVAGSAGGGASVACGLVVGVGENEALAKPLRRGWLQILQVLSASWLLQQRRQVQTAQNTTETQLFSCQHHYRSNLITTAKATRAGYNKGHVYLSPLAGCDMVLRWRCTWGGEHFGLWELKEQNLIMSHWL